MSITPDQLNKPNDVYTGAQGKSNGGDKVPDIIASIGGKNIIKDVAEKDTKSPKKKSVGSKDHPSTGQILEVIKKIDPQNLSGALKQALDGMRGIKGLLGSLNSLGALAQNIGQVGNLANMLMNALPNVQGALADVGQLKDMLTHALTNGALGDLQSLLGQVMSSAQDASNIVNTLASGNIAGAVGQLANIANSGGILLNIIDTQNISQLLGGLQDLNSILSGDLNSIVSKLGGILSGDIGKTLDVIKSAAGLKGIGEFGFMNKSVHIKLENYFNKVFGK